MSLPPAPTVHLALRKGRNPPLPGHYPGPSGPCMTFVCEGIPQGVHHLIKYVVPAGFEPT
jgi:hypothetical protein